MAITGSLSSMDWAFSLKARLKSPGSFRAIFGFVKVGYWGAGSLRYFSVMLIFPSTISVWSCFG